MARHISLFLAGVFLIEGTGFAQDKNAIAAENFFRQLEVSEINSEWGEAEAKEGNVLAGYYRVVVDDQWMIPANIRNQNEKDVQEACGEAVKELSGGVGNSSFLDSFFKRKYSVALGLSVPLPSEFEDGSFEVPLFEFNRVGSDRCRLKVLPLETSNRPVSTPWLPLQLNVSEMQTANVEFRPLVLQQNSEERQDLFENTLGIVARFVFPGYKAFLTENDEAVAVVKDVAEQANLLPAGMSGASGNPLSKTQFIDLHPSDQSLTQYRPKDIKMKMTISGSKNGVDFAVIPQYRVGIEYRSTRLQPESGYMDIGTWGKPDYQNLLERQITAGESRSWEALTEDISAKVNPKQEFRKLENFKFACPDILHMYKQVGLSEPDALVLSVAAGIVHYGVKLEQLNEISCLNGTTQKSALARYGLDVAGQITTGGPLTAADRRLFSSRIRGFFRDPKYNSGTNRFRIFGEHFGDIVRFDGQWSVIGLNIENVSDDLTREEIRSKLRSSTGRFARVRCTIFGSIDADIPSTTVPPVRSFSEFPEDSRLNSWLREGMAALVQIEGSGDVNNQWRLLVVGSNGVNKEDKRVKGTSFWLGKKPVENTDYAFEEIRSDMIDAMIATNDRTCFRENGVQNFLDVDENGASTRGDVVSDTNDSLVEGQEMSE